MKAVFSIIILFLLPATFYAEEQGLIHGLFEGSPVEVEKVTGPFEYYSITSNGENYIFLLTEKMNTSRQGYNGLVHLGILLNEELGIERIILTSHQETQGFIDYIWESGFIEDLKESKDLHSVDVISGATLSCQAIKMAVISSIEMYEEKSMQACSNEKQ